VRRIPFLLVVLSGLFCSPVGPDRDTGAPDPADAPRLAGISPGVDEVRIEAGSSVEFQVAATSPRALPLTITFLVDGAPRAVASGFAFAPDAPGTYTVSAVVSDGELETVHAWTVTVEPANLPPGAVLAVEPGGGEAPLTSRVRVDGDDPDGDVVRFRLEVLGPAPLTLERSAPIDTVLVLAAGQWHATAIVEDDRGATSTVSRPIDVVPPNLPPAPTLLVAPRSGTAPLDVLVDADGTDPDGEIASYLLVIDGELTIESATPIRRSVRFEDPGEFPVVLRVTDDRGAVSRDSVVVTVSRRDPDSPPPPPANSAPAVDLIVTPLEGEAPLEVAARSTGTDADGVVTEVRIDFDGDGEPDADAAGSEIEASFRYEIPGTYAVRATAFDDDGAPGTAVVAVTVRPPSNLPPTGSLSLSITSGEAPLPVLATAAGSDPDGTIVKWEIEANEGDGFLELDESLAASLLYEFDESTYRPRLRLTDDRGATTVIVGPVVTVYRPIGDSEASVRGNDSFASTAIAPAVWSDGQDRWRVTVTVRDHGGEPLADVPLRIIPERASLSAPDGTSLGPGAAVVSGGLRTNGDGVATGTLTTTLSTRIERAPAIAFEPFAIVVEADAGHGRWLQIARLEGLNANTTVSATASRLTIRPPNVAVCPGDPLEIEVVARSRSDAPDAGAPAPGRFVELRYTDGSILPAQPKAGYADWRTDGAGVIRFGYAPARGDQSKLVEAWVDGQPVGQLGIIALKPASEC
jgi:PKD repeat protein